jgi:protein phosphatase
MNDRTHIAPIRSESSTAGVIYAGDSDVSPSRQENQDYMAVATGHGMVLAILADGMGGQSGGFEASRIACNEVKQFFHKQGGNLTPTDLLYGAIESAHQSIQEVVAVSPHMQGMGTTIVCALFTSGKCHIAHVGDSRIYLVRDEKAQLLTLDHSRVNRMVVEGMIKPSQAANHPMGHILERALGASPVIEVEVRPEPIVLQRGDRIAMCSDGVWAAMNDRLFGQVVSRGATVVEASRGCVDTALQKKTEDNATTVVIEAVQGAKRAPLPDDVRVLAGILASPQGATTRRAIAQAPAPTPWWLIVAVAAAAVALAIGVVNFGLGSTSTKEDQAAPALAMPPEAVPEPNKDGDTKPDPEKSRPQEAPTNSSGGAGARERGSSTRTAPRPTPVAQPSAPLANPTPADDNAGTTNQGSTTASPSATRPSDPPEGTTVPLPPPRPKSKNPTPSPAETPPATSGQ